MIPIEGKSNWACGSLPVCSPSPYWNVFLVRRLRQLKIASQVGNWPRKTRTLTHKTITILATRNVKKKEKIRLKGKIPPHRRNYLCWIRFTECLQNKCVFKTNCTLFFKKLYYFLLLTKGKRNIWTIKKITQDGILLLSLQVTGYLNLLANGIDNFTHGLAVAGSFLVSTRVGLLTTAAILLHEIPHEVADFAILLRAGTCTVSFFLFCCCCCYFIRFYYGPWHSNKNSGPLLFRFRTMGRGKGPTRHSNHRDCWSYDGLNIQRFRLGWWSYYILDSTLYGWRLPTYCFGYW